MTCKKVPEQNKKCMCLKRYNDGCSACEKNAIKVVNDSGRNLNEAVTELKATGETIRELYVRVDGLDGKPNETWFRSAVDILRGVCKYCKNADTHICNDCMWASESNSEDHWVFSERFSIQPN